MPKAKKTQPTYEALKEDYKNITIKENANLDSLNRMDNIISQFRQDNTAKAQLTITLHPSGTQETLAVNLTASTTAQVLQIVRNNQLEYIKLIKKKANTILRKMIKPTK